jgi:hypothetical protein
VPAKQPQNPVGRQKSDEDLEKVGLYLPSKLALALRIAAAQRRLRISALAEQLLSEGLARLEGREATRK